MSSLLVIAGTGTGVGKTHVSCALLRAWSAGGASVSGYKPIESGVDGSGPTDQDQLDAAATFHVKHPRLELRAPLSPHLAARDQGITLDWRPCIEHATALRAACAGVLVELAGGLFTPLTDTTRNADLAVALHPTSLVLVALDRLGVLHDVDVCLRAAPDLRIRAIALNVPATPDASTGRNAEELTRLLGRPVVTFPRADPADPRSIAAAQQLMTAVRLR